MKQYLVYVSAGDYIDVEAETDLEAIEHAKDIFGSWSTHDFVDATIEHSEEIETDESTDSTG